MRLVAAFALADQGFVRLSGTPIRSLTFAVIVIAVTALLVAGLWTPVAGALVAFIQMRAAYGHVGDPWFQFLLGTLGVALALLGPGAWSADARLFGWKRIDIRDRKS